VFRGDGKSSGEQCADRCPEECFSSSACVVGELEEGELDLPLQNNVKEFCDQTRAQVTGHHLSVVLIQSRLPGSLPVRQVQPHEIQIQYSHPQRLVMSGQNCPGQIVEPLPAPMAQVALPVPLAIVMTIEHYIMARASGAANTSWPAMMAHKFKALLVADQKRQVDGGGHRTRPKAGTRAALNQHFNVLNRQKIHTSITVAYFL